MKRDRMVWLPAFIAALIMVFLMPTGSMAAQDGSAAAVRSDEELSAIYETACSYYVIDDKWYRFKTGPAAAEDGAYSMTPVALSFRDDDFDCTDQSGHSAESPEAGISEKNERSDSPDIAINMNFRGISEKQPESESEALDAEDIADPLEPINRAFFMFNDKFYFWALKPVSTIYREMVPEWGRTRVSNFFDNIEAPVRLVSSLLQFKMHTFGAELSRFILNSTVGIGGLFDIASRHPELTPAEEDLGQALGACGIGEGFYLVLPLLGPSSLRDSAGTAGEWFLNPVQYITPFRDMLAVRSFDEVNETSFKMGDYEDIKESAIDPYISVRDIYKQYRRNKVRE